MVFEELFILHLYFQEQPVKDWNEQREDFKQEQNQEREREEKLKNEQELQALEERAKKLREGKVEMFTFAGFIYEHVIM